MTPARTLRIARACALASASLFFGGHAAAQWGGFEDRSAERGVDRYDFGIAGGANENYYDGDMGDYDQDGVIDRAVISRFGLLRNAGGGVMIPVSTQRNGTVPPNSSPSLTGYLFGDEVRIGNDGVQFVDLDGDGDLDVIQGGNGEPLVVQMNLGGRFVVTQRLVGSAVQIISTDVERDGDVDLVVSCWFPSGPDDFSLFINDGAGNLSEQADARGVGLRGNQIIGIVSGDVDRDGDFDIVAVSRLAGEVWTLINDGRGNFTRRTTAVSGRFRSTSGFAQGTQLGDIDADGDLDLVMATDDYVGGHPRVGHLIFVNDGAGNFSEESATRFEVEGSFVGQLIGANGKLFDVDYDGDLDLVAFTDLAGPPLNFQLYLNDGTGRFRYSPGEAPAFGGARTNSVGSDVDVADLDGDGTYDLWVGIGGGRVTHLHNSYVDPSGLAADEPRAVRVVSATDPGIRIRWSHPPFAATARHYVVYRALRQGSEPRDRPVLSIVGASDFEDEGFAAPLSRFTNAAELGDADITIDGDDVEWIDRTAVPGVEYHYSIAHVGPENARSRPSVEVRAMLPAAGADTDGPELAITSPGENWMASPRIAVSFADASGVDADSVRVLLDRDLPGAPTGTNLVDFAQMRSEGGVVVMPEGALPLGAVELRVEARDGLGNESVLTHRFGVSVSPRAERPTLAPSASRTDGEAPLDVEFSANASAAGQGEVIRVEWVFGDGSTATGIRPTHRFAMAGNYDVWVRAVDDTGAVQSAELATIIVRPCSGACEPPDAGPGADAGRAGDGGLPDGATTDGGIGADGSEDRIPAASGGCAVFADAGSAPTYWFLVAGAIGLYRRKRR